ncbi:SA1362 family protein [Alkalihalobacterium elongatum]|uniref:SA1362 family protein n=1 Tax=Alkalihalobacterium elongatum TaxID=2675466 RepID=UPI001C1F3E4A|nr:SA1362 family protein [Alkalihalobacterium elongatum]
MSRKMYNPLVLILIGLAVLGFFYRLITEPLQLLTSIIVFGAIAAILFFLYKRFLAKQFGVEGTSHRPKQQVKNKIKKTTNVIPHRKKVGQKKSTRTLNKRGSAPNLTVIEGKKGKKKNRALF